MSGKKLPLPESEPAVSDDEVALFRRDGLLRINLRDLLGDDAIDGMCEGFLRAEKEGFPAHSGVAWNDNPKNSLIYLHYMYKYYPEFAVVSLSPRIGEVAARLAGVPHVRLFYDQAMIKLPGMDVTPWHQDMPYLPFVRRNHVAFWIAIEDLDETMGLTTYLERSHKLGPLPLALSYDPKKANALSEDEYVAGRTYDNVLAALRDDDRQVVGDIVSFPLRSGEAIIHDGLLVHGAAANRSGKRRRILQLTIIPDDTQYNGMPFPDTDGLGISQYSTFDHPNFPLIY